MNNTIEYRPFRAESWAFPVMLILTICDFVILGGILHDISFETFSNLNFGACFFLLLGIVSTWCLKILYNDSNIVTLFELECLRIVGGKWNNYCCIPWEKVTYAYYTRNFKGFPYMVLSPKALDKKQLKKEINRSSFSAKLCIDSIIVIPINPLTDDNLKKILQIKEFIKQKIPNITDYSEY